MPIVNDTVYNSARKPTGRLMLAATELSLKHPRTSKRLDFEIPIPVELRNAIARDRA